MPVGAELHDLVVEVNADSAAHADDHRLAVHRFESFLKVVYEVFGDGPKPLLRADDGFHRSPLRAQPLPPLYFFAFRRFLEVRIDLRLFCFRQFQLRQSALVVDRYGRLVFDRTLDVVDADVIAEHGSGVGVGLLDGCPSEPDERCVRQRIPHVACEAVDEVVLAAVRLVSDHDDVAPIRKLGDPSRSQAA